MQHKLNLEGVLEHAPYFELLSSCPGITAGLDTRVLSRHEQCCALAPDQSISC